jgi:hypothetical protein
MTTPRDEASATRGIGHGGKGCFNACVIREMRDGAAGEGEGRR